MVNGVREPASGKVERDTELVMGLCKLARRYREELRFERQASAVVRDRLLKFLYNSIFQYKCGRVGVAAATHPSRAICRLA